MCIETITSYSNCLAIRHHLDVCASHIAHTRKQLDNTPCPSFTVVHQHITHTTRCNCKDASRMIRHAGYGVSLACVRKASKGYGQNGLTWSFERGEREERTKREAKRVEEVKVTEDFNMSGEGENGVKVKMEGEENDVDKSWKAMQAAGGFRAGGFGLGGTTGGRSASSGRAEDAFRRNQMMEEPDRQQAKKIKVENSDDHANLPPLGHFKIPGSDDDLDMS